MKVFYDSLIIHFSKEFFPTFCSFFYYVIYPLFIGVLWVFFKKYLGH